MTLQLYGHPFAAFVWKPLIAAYERNVPFTFRTDCGRGAAAKIYADWVHQIPDGPLNANRARLLKHPSVARVVDEARPCRRFFPLGAPDRD